MVINLSYNAKFIEQVSNLETTYGDISEIYDIAGAKGLSHECIQRLPQSTFRSSNMIESCNDFCCSICLQVGQNTYSVCVYIYIIYYFY